MARIRTIKPEFWTSEKVVKCSVTARLLFIGLWNFCDDEGRIKDSPCQIKMNIFPGDDYTTDDIHCLLSELSVSELLKRYTVDNKSYLQVVGWDHQKINRRNPSRIPPPTKEIHGVLSESTLPEGKGRDRKVQEGKETPLTPLKTQSEGSVTFSCFLKKCFDVAGIDPAKIVNPGHHTGSTAAAKAWIAAGADFEDHVKPVIREKLTYGRLADSKFHPATLKYYHDAVLERVKEAVPDGGWEDTETPQWRVRVGAWVKTSKWMVDLHGPPPDDPDTQVPAAVLDEFLVGQGS